MTERTDAILVYLLANEWSSASEIAGGCGHAGDTWWASQGVNSLAQRGFVDRRPGRTHRQYRDYRLTEKGFAAAREIEAGLAAASSP